MPIDREEVEDVDITAEEYNSLLGEDTNERWRRPRNDQVD
jgi:hypothetical protein